MAIGSMTSAHIRIKKNSRCRTFTPAAPSAAAPLFQFSHILIAPRLLVLTHLTVDRLAQHFIIDSIEVAGARQADRDLLRQPMRIKFLGSGDAFGSGGRFNACFLIEATRRQYLIDCGASSMIALRKFEIDPNTIDAIFVSHFDIDHFGGAPLLAMEGHLLGERTRPLAIAGPVGLRHRFYQWIDLSLPSRLTSRQLRYELNLIELAPEHGELEIAGARVTPFPVNHFGSDVGAPPLALRLQIDGQVLAYTGDTDWVASLVPCGRGADLLIAEAWHYRSNYRFHLDFVTLQQHLGQIGAKRVIVTHMNQDMIDRAKSDSLGIEAAEDGKVVEV